MVRFRFAIYMTPHPDPAQMHQRIPTAFRHVETCIFSKDDTICVSRSKIKNLPAVSFAHAFCLFNLLFLSYIRK